MRMAMQTLYAKEKIFDIFYSLFGFAVILIGRWYSIVYPLALNPDEVQMAANASRISSYGWNWNQIDGTTVGPLNSIVLLWPKLFSMDVTLSLTRLTGSVLLAFVFIFSYFSLKLVTKRVYATVFSFTLLIFYALTRSNDFTHYSSELLPVFLLMLANYVFLSTWLNSVSSSWYWITQVVLGFAIGAIFFAKLQGAPLAAVIFISNVLYIALSLKRFRLASLSLFVASCATPYICFLVPLLLGNAFLDFYNSYIVNARLYLMNPTSIFEIHRMIVYCPMLKILTYFSFLCICTGCLWNLLYNKTSRDYTVLLYFAFLLVVSVYIAAKPGRPFPHYLMLFVPFMIMFAGGQFSGKALTKWVDLLIGIILLLCALAYMRVGAHNYYHYKKELSFSLKVENGDIYSWIKQDYNCGLVWGWMPQYYLLGEIIPASRETHNEAQLKGENILSDYYRSRFLSDIEESKPEIIVDAVAGNSFTFNKPLTHGINVMPEISRFVLGNYMLLQNDMQKDDCPHIYLTTDVYTHYQEKIVPIKTIQELTPNIPSNADRPPTNLNDLSVTEDSCKDYWVAPDAMQSEIRIDFDGVFTVEKIMLLNTMNGNYLDRASTKVLLTLLKENITVYSKSHKVKFYPYWTSASIDNILEFSGKSS